MFSPNPTPTNFHFVVAGRTKGGVEVELWGNGNLWRHEIQPLNWSVIPDYPGSFGNHRGFKFFEVYAWQGGEHVHDFRLHVGRWFCRKFNAKYEDPLHTFDIYYLASTHKMDGPPTPWQKIHYWGHHCFDEEDPVDPEEEQEEQEEKKPVVEKKKGKKNEKKTSTKKEEKTIKQAQEE